MFVFAKIKVILVTQVIILDLMEHVNALNIIILTKQTKLIYLKIQALARVTHLTILIRVIILIILLKVAIKF